MSIRQTRLSPQCSQPENALSEGFRGNWEKKREGAVGKEEREVHARTRASHFALAWPCLLASLELDCPRPVNNLIRH